MEYSRMQQLIAEGVGTAFLLMAVIGSGIMGDRLAGGNAAVALLANSLATGAALVVLISVLGPVSGAHFNPAVTLAFCIRREMRWTAGVQYICVQMIAALAGVWIAHAMFDLPVIEMSQKARDGSGQFVAEFVATFGLLLTIFGGSRHRPAHVPALVGLYIGAAYWFTASTSFANPAVTIARMFTDTFAGIHPSSAPLFIAAQLLATFSALLAFRAFGEKPRTTSPGS